MKKENYKFYWEEPYETESSSKKEASIEPHVTIEVPGFKKDEIQAKLSNNAIVIQAAKKKSEERKGKNFYHAESFASSFSTTLSLPHNINANEFDVVVTDGKVVLKRKKKKMKEVEN